MGYLGLTRRVNESILIYTPGGDVIRVVLAQIRGDKVRLAFEAPQEVAIVRQELLADGRVWERTGRKGK